MKQTFTTIFFLYLIFLLGNNQLKAQNTETFEDEVITSTFFTNSSNLYVMSGSNPLGFAVNDWGVGSLPGGAGYLSSKKFIDNSTSPSTNSTWKINCTTPFKVDSFFLFPSSDGGSTNQKAGVTITVIGKRANATVFTYNINSGVINYSAADWNNAINRGFTKIDLVSAGFNNSVIDELSFVLGSSTNYLAIDNLSFPSTSTPSITVTGTLNAFNTCSGNSSTEQSFNVSGTGLTTPLTVLAPNGYSVSLSANSGYGPSISILPVSGSVSNTPVYVKLFSTPSSNPSQIVCSSLGATSQNISVSGVVNTGTFNTTTTSACNSFTWNGRTYTSSTTDTFSYLNSNGCFSVDTLKLTINTGTFSTLVTSACNTYTWSANGQTYTASGTYVRNYSNASGCASADTLHLTINTGTFSATTQSACNSYIWAANGQTYTASGTYIRNYNNANGCASADTLKLTIKSASTSSQTLSGCDSILWNGTKYTSSGIYTWTGTNILGCDSVVTLNLTINNSTNNITSTSSCNSFTWNGRTYTSSTTDTFSYVNSNGCFSVDTLKLTINTGTFNTTSTSSCNSFTWNGRTYTSSTTDTFSYINSNGCFSVDTLKLIIKSASTSNQTLSGCDSILWNGTKYTSSGIYTWTGTNILGCDSVVTLNLTINNSTNNITTTSSCGSFTWNGRTYTSSTTDTFSYTNSNGCFSVDTLKLTINTGTFNTTSTSSCNSFTWNGRTYTSSTTDTFSYVNSNGCFSVDTLKLTINTGTFNTNSISSCDSFTWNGRTYTISTTDTFSYINSNGCLSVDTLKLTINNSSQFTFTASACGSYTWALNGKTYTSSNNTDTVMLKNVNGCDSIVTLNLTILANITGVQINNVGAYCGDTAKATLSSNINYTYGSVSYQWSSLPFTGTGWQFEGNDSVLNVLVTEPRQYVLQVTIAGCGTFWSNQEMVMPVKAPVISLAPSSDTSICNNSIIDFVATNNDGGENNFSFWKGTTQVQTGSQLSYTTPILTTADNGAVYKLEATNVKPIFDGNINENFWGVPLAVSTWGPSSGFGAGHELNALYARADANNIYLAIAGNVQNNNRIMLFVDSKTGGYNNGNYGRGGLGNNAIRNFNSGNIFDPGFNPDYCVGIGTDASRSQFYFDLVEMVGNAATGTSVNNYIGSSLSPVSGYSLGASPANGTQTQGFEMAIPKSALGYTGGEIRVFAMYSSDNGFLSNQFLTRATISSGNYGNGVVNFGQAAPDPIVIPVSSLSNLVCKSSLSRVITVKANATSEKFDTICNNQLPYTWGAKTISVAGTYRDTAVGSNACDSFAVLHLFVKDTTISTTPVTVCNNQLPYLWNGNSYSTSGNYSWLGKNIAGCDSIATLVLTISDTSISSTSQTACDSLVWNGTTYKTSGTYTFKTTNAAGCDSIATLNLTINNSSISVTTQTACDSLVWNGITYKTSGTYTFTTPNAIGCDSVATLVLTINKSSISTTLISVCNNQLPYVWNGTPYTTSGTYTYTTSNANGCDSTASLVLTVSDTTTSIITTSSCDSMIWGGTVYYTSGTYSWIGLNAAGCDSLAILNLTINPSPIAPTIITSTSNVSIPATGVAYSCTSVPNAFIYSWSYTGTGATIVSGQGTENITVDFAANATDGRMQVIAVSFFGCNSKMDTVGIVLPISIANFTANKLNNTAMLNWNSVLEINAKEYQVQRSVDGRSFENIGIVNAKGKPSNYSFVDNNLPTSIKVIYYRLKLVDRDGKFSFSETRQIETANNKVELNIYPNPTKNILYVKTFNAKQIRIFDVLGKIVYESIVNGQQLNVNCENFLSGTYFIEAIAPDGSKQINKFIKQ